jgi:hypothetical protein
MASIGFSTGSLYKLNISMDENVALLHSLGMEAIELSFATPKELFSYKPTLETQNILKNFRYISIHAPWKNVGYSSGPKTEKLLHKLNYLCSKMHVKGVVLHPDTILDFQNIAKTKFPFLMENLAKKKYSDDSKQFEILKEKYDFGFVLDVQHAYLKDPSMELAEKLFKVMGNKLRQLHVSGGSASESHSLIHLSNNKEAIENFLKEHNKVHWILEGIVEKDVLPRLKKELEYLKKLQ